MITVMILINGKPIELVSAYRKRTLKNVGYYAVDLNTELKDKKISPNWEKPKIIKHEIQEGAVSMAIKMLEKKREEQKVRQMQDIMEKISDKKIKKSSIEIPDEDDR